MSGGSGHGPDGRRDFFVDQRLAGANEARQARGTKSVPVVDAAERRLEQLRLYRELRTVSAGAPNRKREARSGPAVSSPGVIGQLNWIPIGPSAVLHGQASGQPVVSGRCQDLGVSSDGQRIFAGTANGGVWRSLDGGGSWTPMSDEFDVDPLAQQVDSLAVGALALVEGADAEHDRLYVGTGEGFAGSGPGRPTDFFGVGMVLSTNGGRTWTRENAAPPLVGFGVFEIAVDSSDPEHALAATTNGLYRRVSAASGWLREPNTAPLVPAGRFTSVLAARRGGATRFYAVAAGVVYEGTTTAGAWTVVAGFPGGTGRVSLAASTSDPPVIYALAANGSLFNGVHRVAMTLPAASVWSTIADTPSDLFGDPPGQGHYDQAIVVDPNDATTLYVGGSGRTVSGEFSANIFRLEVSAHGTGFRSNSNLIGGGSHADVQALKFRPGSSRELWAGCDGGVYYANDAKGRGNSHFESRNVGLATLTLMGLGHHPSEESYAFCGAQDNGGLRYLGDEVWDHQLPGDGGDTVVDWNTGDRLVNGYVNGDVRRAAIDGGRYSDSDISPPIKPEKVLFYPPIVGVAPTGNPADAGLIAFGAESPYVSTNFGSGWAQLPHRSGAGGLPIRSLCFAGPIRLYAGWIDGHVARYDLGAGGWARTDIAPPGEGRPITCIALDPADPTGSSVFVTIGGASVPAGSRVRHVNSAPVVAAWTVLGAGLLEVQHNAIVIDPATPTRRFVAADLGVWQWDNPNTTWQPFSGNLPDAAVLDLDLLPGGQLLRATTHGRGVWEMDISRPNTPPVELMLRANVLDQRRRLARAGAPLIGDRSRTSRLDASPDIVVDAPGDDGRYSTSATSPPNLVTLLANRDANAILASVPEAPAITRVYVTVRDRGIRPANPSLDAVRVALLIGPAGDNDDTAPALLPATFAQAAVAGTPIDADGWKTVGIHELGGLKAGAPVTVKFDLHSDLLAVAYESKNKQFVLLALVHHVDDPFPVNAVRDPIGLVTAERHAAMRRVVVHEASGAAAAGGAASGAPANPAGGTGLLVPVTTALLAFVRLSDVVDQLQRKVHASRVAPGFGGFQRSVAVHPVERRVLAMAIAARDAMRAGPTAQVPRELPGSGIGSYALLGALGFELPGFTSVLAPGGGWVADLMRRGTPDPDKSLVAVPAAEFPLAVGRLGVNTATASAATKQRITAFSTGMLAAAAAGVTVGPQLADLLTIDTNRDWHRHSPSSGAAVLERHLRRRFLGGDDTPSTLAKWLPAASDVPVELWDSYVKALDEVYHLSGQRPLGFPAFEEGFDAGDPITATRLRNAYGLVLDDLRTSSWPWTAWWGLLAPILLAPSVAMLIARTELPHGRAFFERDGRVTERSVFELLTLAMGLGSLAPFLYSMILWGAVDEHTTTFATALIMFLVRAGLVVGGLGTSGQTDQSEPTRWLGIFAPLAALDVGAAIAAAIAGSRRPGVSTVFGLQTIPLLTGLATLGVSGLFKATGVSDGWPFWLAWSVETAGVLFGVGIPIAIALANGGGWRSWFMRSDRRFPLLSSVAATGLLPAEPTATARVFDPSTLWADPATVDADLSTYAYPSGLRPLAKVWWEGNGTLEIQHDADRVVLRHSGFTTPLRLPVGTTGASFVSQIGTALAGVKAVQPKAGGLDPALPWPHTLADPGDAGPAIDAAVASQRFTPVGSSTKQALVLRHAPRADLSTPMGLDSGSAEAFPVIPAASLGDLEGSGLGDAADLTTLLAMAAQPTFAPVAVADGLAPLADPTIKEVVQTFRRWNLDERRLEEWQSLVTGGAPLEGSPPAGPNPFVRTPPPLYAGAQPVGFDLVDQMGWLPLWKAWLRMSSDPAADAGAGVALASTPLVRFRDGSARRPTNAELTEGVRFLLDLGAA